MSSIFGSVLRGRWHIGGTPVVAAAPESARPPARLVVVLLAVAAVSYSAALSVVVPVLVPLRSTFHASQAGAGWILTAYLLASAVLTPALGRLGDYLGKKQVISAATGLLALGSLMAALAPSLGVLLAGRALQGASAAILPLAFGIARELVPAQRLGSVIGVIAALTSVGTGAGLLAAGPVVSAVGVRWLFWGPAIVNGSVAVLFLVLVPGSRVRSAGRLNWSAAVAMSAALVCLLLPLSLGQIWGWDSAATLSLLASAAAFTVIWVAVELRARTPLIDMRMMRLAPVWTANLASLLFGVGLYSAVGYLPSYLQAPAATGYGFGASITGSGWLSLPMTIAMLITGVVAGPLSRRVPSRVLLMAGSLPQVACFALLASLHGHRWLVVLATTIGGLGFGMGLAALSAYVVRHVPPAHTGAAAGMNANIRTIGGAAGAAVVSTILAASTTTGGPPTEHGFTVAFLALMIAAVISAAVCLLVPRKEHN